MLEESILQEHQEECPWSDLKPTLSTYRNHHSHQEERNNKFETKAKCVTTLQEAEQAEMEAYEQWCNHPNKHHLNLYMLAIRATNEFIIQTPSKHYVNE
jgi:hypothetical protein